MKNEKEDTQQAEQVLIRMKNYELFILIKGLYDAPTIRLSYLYQQSRTSLFGTR
jgi:hypothetical protein